MAPKRRATTLDMGDFASPARSTSSDEDDDYARFGSRKAALSVSKRRRTEMAQVELSSSDVEILGPPVKRGARVGEGSTANGATLGDRTNKAVVQRPSASSAETVILLSDDSEAADSSDLEIVDCRTDAASSLTEVAYKADEGFLANVLHRVDVSSDVDLGNDYVGYCRDDEEPMLIDDQISPSAITLLNLPAGVLDIVWSFLADDCAGGRAVCKTLLPQTSAWRAPFAAIASGSQCAIGSGRDGQKQAVEPARAPVSKPASSSVDHAEDEDGDAYEVLEHSAWIETFYDQLKADGKLPASVNKSREALLLAFRRRHTALARADAPAPADLPTDGYVVGFPSVLYSLIVQIYQRIKSDTFGSKVDPAVLAYFTENSPRVIFDYVAPVYTDYPATQELYLALRRGKQVQLGTYLRRLSQLERTALLYAHEGLSTEHAGGNRFSEVPVLGRYVGKAVVWKARWRTYLNGISRHMTGVHVQALYDFYLGEYNVGRHDGYPAARPDSPPLWTSFIVHRLPEATTWNESFVSIFETIACDALGAYDHHSMLLPEYCREKGVERDCSLTPENGAIGLNRAYPICAPQSQAIRASALDRFASRVSSAFTSSGMTMTTTQAGRSTVASVPSIAPHMPQEQVRVKDAQDADTLVFRYTANGVHLSTAAGVDVTSKVVGAGLHVLERLVKTTFQVLEIHERMDYGDLDVARYKLEHGMEALAGPDSPSVSSSTASPITAAPAASSPSSKSSATPAPAAGSSAHSHSASSASPASRLAPASSSASSSAPSRLASSSAPSRLATSSAPSRLATSSAPSRLATSSASSRSASSAALAPAAASTSALAPAAASTSSASSRLASSAALAPAAASTSALAPAAASTSSVSSSSASSTLRGKERQLAFVPHPPWTQSELDALKAGREATPQKSWAELADITGHTAVACDNTWRRKFGKASSSASTSAPKRSRWTGEDDAKLDRLRARGLSDSAIAAQLGRTVSAVKQRSAGRVNNAALALAAPQPAPRQPAPAPSASTSTSAGPSASAIGQALRNLEKRSYYQHASTPNRVALEEAARASGAGVPRLMGKITTYNVYTTTTRRSSTRPSLYFNAPGLSSWHQTESYPVSLTVLRANAPHILTPGLHQVSVEAAQPYELQYHCADGARSTVGKLADLLSSAQYSTARQWIDNVQAEKDGRAPTTASLQANQAVQDARLARLARRNRAHEEGEDDAALNGDGMGGDDDA